MIIKTQIPGSGGGYQYIQTNKTISTQVLYLEKAIENAVVFSEDEVYKDLKSLVSNVLEKHYKKDKERLIGDILLKNVHENIVGVLGLESMIDRVLNGLENEGKINIIDYESEEEPHKYNYLVVCKPSTIYLLNNEGKTIDIIK